VPAFCVRNRGHAILKAIRAATCLLALALALAGNALAFAAIGEVRADALRPEAQRTLALIRAGGPIAYSKDGRTFGNRERILPARPRGYYREYTVPTPGARDRGARRIVSGQGGERYYTEDHYRSFLRILE
jgi:ribonuclease T1